MGLSKDALQGETKPLGEWVVDPLTDSVEPDFTLDDVWQALDAYMGKADPQPDEFNYLMAAKKYGYSTKYMQNKLKELENQGVVTSRLIGRSRWYKLVK